MDELIVVLEFVGSLIAIFIMGNVLASLFKLDNEQDGHRKEG